MDIFELTQKFKNTGDELPRSTKGMSPQEEENIIKQKELRKALKLPITKSLVYYYHPYNKGDSPVPVISYDARHLTDNKGEPFGWYIVDVEVMGDSEIKHIHGDYFAEMQSPSFIDEIENATDDE